MYNVVKTTDVANMPIIFFVNAQGIGATPKAAGINRNTFYLHYNCVDDVLETTLLEKGMKGYAK